MKAETREVLANVLGVVGLLLALIACLEAWRESTRVMCIDYYQAWVTGTAVREGDTSDPYARGEGERLDRLYDQKALAFVGPREEDWVRSRRMHAAHTTQAIRSTGTPFLYTVFGLLAGVDYDADQRFWLAASIAALALGSAWLARAVGFPLAALGFVAAFFVRAYLPARSDLWVGNVARAQLGWLALALAVCNARLPARESAEGDTAGRARSRRALPGRDLLGGFLLGLLAAFKPNLAPALVVLALGWALSRQYGRLARTAGGIACGALAAFAGASAFFGNSRAWGSWLGQLSGVVAPGRAGEELGNVASSGVLSPKLVAAGLLVVSALALVLARRTVEVEEALRHERARARFDVLCAGLGASLVVLASPLAWMHYFVFLVPLALWTLRPAPLPRLRGEVGFSWRWGTGAAALAGLFCVALPFEVVDPDGARAAELLRLGAWLLFAAALADCALPGLRRGSSRTPRTPG